MTTGYDYHKTSAGVIVLARWDSEHGYESILELPWDRDLWAELERDIVATIEKLWLLS